MPLLHNLGNSTLMVIGCQGKGWAHRQGEPTPSSNQSRLCQLLVLQLLNTLIFYFHGRVQTVNLIDSQFANFWGIWLENVVADGMESQPKLVLLHALAEEIKKGVITLSHQHRSKGL